MDLLKLLKVINDFPTKGIKFLDITPLMLNPESFKEVIDFFNSVAESSNADVLVAPEARGFLLASPAALSCEMPLLMLRKAGKLPDDGTQVKFGASKEYGTSEFAVNMSDLDYLKSNNLKRIAIVDDVLATGGTSLAIASFFKDSGFEVVCVANLIEINGLGGSKLLLDNGFSSKSLIKF